MLQPFTFDKFLSEPLVRRHQKLSAYVGKLPAVVLSKKILTTVSEEVIVAAFGAGLFSSGLRLLSKQCCRRIGGRQKALLASTLL